MSDKKEIGGEIVVGATVDLVLGATAERASVVVLILPETFKPGERVIATIRKDETKLCGLCKNPLETDGTCEVCGAT